MQLINPSAPDNVERCQVEVAQVEIQKATWDMRVYCEVNELALVEEHADA